MLVVVGVVAVTALNVVAPALLLSRWSCGVCYAGMVGWVGAVMGGVDRGRGGGGVAEGGVPAYVVFGTGLELAGNMGCNVAVWWHRRRGGEGGCCWG